MLEISWESLNSITAAPIPIPALKLWKKQYICRLAQRRVSISSSTTFHSVSSRPMPLVSVVPFGISTRIVHPNSWGVSLVCHM